MGPSVETLKWAWRQVPTPVRKKIKKQLPNQLVSRFSTPNLNGPQAETLTTLPLLTVVIPVYNVERYLAACIQSVIGQTYTNLEILIVDDGSTDSSYSIASKFSESDARIRIIQKANAGLGAARNTGIAVASGQFIAFADSDDVVPPSAYSTMMASLRETGSDFAIGSLNRLIGAKREVPAWARRVHSSERKAIQLGDYPDILEDVFAWNKVFRKDFWDENVGFFPEGVLYEDQEPTARAYLSASKFDVLREVVYDWRIREDRSSITQKKGEIRDLVDRLNVCISTRRVLEEHASSEVFDSWLTKVLGPDLGQYYVQVPRTGEDYWKELRNGIEEITPRLSPKVLQDLSVNNRLMVYLILADSRDDVIKVAVHQSEYGSKYPVDIVNGQLSARPAYLPTLTTDIPDDILRVKPSQLKVKSRITAMAQTGPRTVNISGYAYIEGLRSDPSAQVSVSLNDAHSTRSIMLPTKMTQASDVDLVANDPWVSYQHSSFDTELDVDRALAEGLIENPGSEWVISLNVTQSGISAAGIVESRDMSGTAATLPLLSAKAGRRFIFRFSQEHGLSILPMSYKRSVTDASVSGREVKLQVELPEAETAVRLRLDNPTSNIRREFLAEPGGIPNKFRFILPGVPQDNPTTNARWKVRVETQDGKLHHLAWTGTTPELRPLGPDSGQCVTLGATGYGYLEVYERPWQVVAHQVNISDDSTTILVTGTASYSDSGPERIVLPRVFLGNDHKIIEPQSLSWEGANRFSARFAVSHESTSGHNIVPESALYTLRAHSPSGSPYWVPVAHGLEQILPFETSSEDVRIRVSRTPKAGALAITFSPPFVQEERGRLRQTAIQKRIPGFLRRGVINDATLFESFGGTGVSDSGLGIFNEMLRRGDDSPKYWSVKDASVPVPTGAERLIRYSRRWYEVLHSAEYVVNNNNFPFFYRKNPGQKYVQTWHGTPLKKIANDIPTSSLSLSYLSLMQRESKYWDYLLAQNDFAAATLPSAFGYGGQVLNLGYPRNDALIRDTSINRRDVVRESLGIEPGQKAVLYAPTWRDNIRSFNNRYLLTDYLDYSVAGEVLGDHYVFLLRGHSNVAASRSATHPGVIDVTTHPDINDLFLAADVLVTDYSSVMFDFCVTDKPIYFLTPDLENYRDTVRGFYFDFEATAPGPLCRDTLELAEAIASDLSASAYADKYSDFKARFAPRDDGYAASRIIQSVWGR